MLVAMELVGAQLVSALAIVLSGDTLWAWPQQDLHSSTALLVWPAHTLVWKGATRHPIVQSVLREVQTWTAIRRLLVYRVQWVGLLVPVP